MRYSDPRVAEMVLSQQWGTQRGLLTGHQPWETRPDAGEGFAPQAEVMARLHGLGFLTEVLPAGAGVLISADLPPEDNLTPMLVAGFRLQSLGVRILRLSGPVAVVETVPVFQGDVWGLIEGRRAPLEQGLFRDVYIVGRADVRQVTERTVYRHDATGGLQRDRLSVAGEVVETSPGHVRRSLRKAKQTARVVASAIAAWDAHLARERLREERSPFTALTEEEISDLIRVLER